MNRKKIEMIVTLILAVIFVFSVIRVFRISKTKKRIKIAEDIVQKAESIKIVQDSAINPFFVTGIDTESSDDLQIVCHRCPFSGKIYSAMDTPVTIKLELGGIIWDSKNPKALINNEIVQEGDTIGKYKILKIYENSIKFTDGANEYALEL